MCGTIGNTIILHEAKARSGVLSVNVVKDTVDNEAVLFGLLVGRWGPFENSSHVLLVERLVQPL